MIMIRIKITVLNPGGGCHMVIYAYDGQSTWHFEHTFYLHEDHLTCLGMLPPSFKNLAIGRHDTVAVGDSDHVDLFRKSYQGVWEVTQSLIYPGRWT